MKNILAGSRHVPASTGLVGMGRITVVICNMTAIKTTNRTVRQSGTGEVVEFVANRDLRFRPALVNSEEEH